MRNLLLQLTDLQAGYGETVVLEDINLQLDRGEALSIIGRNGVGKTTLLATMMGHAKLHLGSIRLNGSEIGNAKTYQRVWQGLGYVPQEREIFPSLTVQENLAVAARSGAWNVQRVFDLFPRLYERSSNLGNQLSGGEQQMLAIGRALVGNPLLLLMDEPSEGLAPVIVEQLQTAMARLRDEESLTIILVEQNSRVALGFAERCLVMNRGRIVHDGQAAKLRADRALLDSLIGVDSGAA
jgi:branched-chain amino acid transport system ATP-binding protein